MENRTVTLIVPRYALTFPRIAGETDEQARNRFIYSILTDKNNLISFAEHLIKDSYTKGNPTEENNTPWFHSLGKIVSEETMKKSFTKCNHDE